MFKTAATTIENLASIVRTQVQELADLKAENRILREQLTREQTNFDWLRVRVNALEQERAALLLKQAGVYVPTPTLLNARVDEIPKPLPKGEMTFDQVGGEAEE